MNIKTLFSLLFLMVMCSGVKAQRHEIGMQLGMSNLVGDIGNTSYILQRPITERFYENGLPFYGGFLYRMNFNPYQTVRLNLGYSHIQFDDAYAKENFRRNRGLRGTNSIFEADLLFEYNLFPVNDEQISLLSPYIFAGIGGIVANIAQMQIEHDYYRKPDGSPYNPETESIPANLIVNGQQDFKTTRTFAQAQKATGSLPFGVGLKYKFNYNWALFGELKFRPTFSDAIDYSVIGEKDTKVLYNRDIAGAMGRRSLLQEEPYLSVAKAREADLVNNREVGNINSKDWVNSITIGLSYSFGRPPCYCEQ